MASDNELNFAMLAATDWQREPSEASNTHEFLTVPMQISPEDYEELPIEEKRRFSKLINDLDDAAMEAVDEAFSAAQKWPPFNSAHEGFSVMHEEFDELWDHVKVNQKKRDLVAMKAEAVQVAAMAMRFIVDICNETNGRK